VPDAPALAVSALHAGDHRLIVFGVANVSFAIHLDRVAEIIRVPKLALMPLMPASLMGLANLHGAVLPVVSGRQLLMLPDAPPGETARVIVLAGAAPVGFMVDRIEHLTVAAADQVSIEAAGAGGLDPDLLEGTIKGGEGESTIRILNPQRLLETRFSEPGMRSDRVEVKTAVAVAAPRPNGARSRQQMSLVSFEVAGQEYALSLGQVRAIVAPPEHVAELALTETAVMGVITFRGRLLPLVSLRALLGMPSDVERERRGKVVVVSIGNGAVGIVTDRTREILRVDADLIDPAPALLTRGSGEAEITSICRIDGGRRLVALLSSDRLFRSDLVRRVLVDSANEGPDKFAEMGSMADEQFIVFLLGDQEFGLPIAAVDEIVRAPEQMTRVPRAPDFVDGLINVRGGVVPIVDLCRRFALPAADRSRARRILVMSVRSGKAGFLVDGISGVSRISAGALRPAPKFTSAQMRLIDRVANLEAEGRLVLLIDPAQLLDRLEADILARFDDLEFGPTRS
jgi:purine-binding chemotaxis protein CheW